MPLTAHGSRMKARLEKFYGKEKGDQVLYASRNAGKKGFENIDRSGAGNAMQRRVAANARGR